MLLSLSFKIICIILYTKSIRIGMRYSANDVDLVEVHSYINATQFIAHFIHPHPHPYPRVFVDGCVFSMIEIGHSFHSLCQCNDERVSPFTQIE